MGKYRVIYITALIAAIIGYIATDQSQMLLLAGCLVIALLISAFFWLFSLRHMKLNIEIEDVSTVGKQLPIKLVLGYDGWAPTGAVELRMEYVNCIFEDTVNQNIMLKPGKMHRMEYVLPFIPVNCGKLVLRVKEIGIFDLLGILRYSGMKGKETETIIYPRLTDYEIEQSGSVGAQNYGEYFDVTHKGQDVSEVFDMRDYRQGDSVKSIHWKLSGKLDKLIVREFGNPANYHTAIMYNLDVPEQLDDTRKRELQNEILAMTASISKSLIYNGVTHHMITFHNSRQRENLVEDQNSFLSILAEMMCIHILDKPEAYSYQMQMMTGEERFTKLIFVCGKLDIKYIHQFAEKENVTVIYLALEGKKTLEKGRNYSILTVPLEKEADTLRMIEI